MNDKTTSKPPRLSRPEPSVEELEQMLQKAAAGVLIKTKRLQEQAESIQKLGVAGDLKTALMSVNPRMTTARVRLARLAIMDASNLLGKLLKQCS